MVEFRTGHENKTSNAYAEPCLQIAETAVCLILQAI